MTGRAVTTRSFTLTAELETAFLETVVRDRFVQRGERRIPLTDVTGRGWAQFTTHGKSPLRLLDIRAEGCVIVGAPTDVLRARHQAAGRAFARAIYAQHHDVDGLLYSSRLSGIDCYAVFDRALARLRELDQGELKHHPALPDLLEKYDIRLVD